MPDDLEKERGAARRRATYLGEVVRLGDDKPALYSGRTALERWALESELVRRLAALTSGMPESIPRANWPGEVFNIDERNAKLR